MKNLKMYKSLRLLLFTSSITLLSGCSVSEISQIGEEKEKSCTHFTIYFENEPVTFKECDGYEVDCTFYGESGNIRYYISYDDKKIINQGFTNQYNYYKVDHDEIDENLLVPQSVKKIK